MHKNVLALINGLSNAGLDFLKDDANPYSSLQNLPVFMDLHGEKFRITGIEYIPFFVETEEYEKEGGYIRITTNLSK